MSTMLDTQLSAIQGVITLPNGTEVRTFPSPPADFDPAAASSGDLARYGFPIRPADAGQHQAWRRLVRNGHAMSPIFQPLDEADPAARLPAAGESTDIHMGGAITPMTQVPVWVAETLMTVPNLVPPAGASPKGTTGASFWVAIADGENYLVKVGCQCLVDGAGSGGARRTVAFWEWQPAGGAFAVPNLPVVPGDALWFAIESDHTSARFHLLNLTTGVGTDFEIGAPVGDSITGHFAAWMVEPLGDPPSLAQFGRTFLDVTNAYTIQNAHLGPDSQLIDLVDPSGRVLARPELRAANLLMIYSENLEVGA